MNLRDVARYYDKDPVYDGYSGALLFMGHTKSHDDHASSGATSRRRTLVTIPGTSVPARGVVTLYGDRWLMSTSNVDTYQGSNIRRSYDLKKSTGLLTLYTPGAACLSTPSTTFYAHKEYFRDVSNPRSESDMDLMWNIFCPLSDAVVKGSFLEDAFGLMRVRNIYRTVSGLAVAETDQFDAGARLAATFTSNGVHDMVTDTMTTISTATTVIQTDISKFYEFSTQDDAEVDPGDLAVFVAKTALTPKVGATFTMAGKPWRAVKVMEDLDAWVLQARLA